MTRNRHWRVRQVGAELGSCAPTSPSVNRRRPYGLLIPTKPPVYNGMIAPRDSWMMPPSCNEMIPPGAPRLLALEVLSRYGGSGQAVLDCLPRARRRLSPVNSMR